MSSIDVDLSDLDDAEFSEYLEILGNYVKGFSSDEYESVHTQSHAWIKEFYEEFGEILGTVDDQEELTNAASNFTDQSITGIKSKKQYAEDLMAKAYEEVL